MSRVLVGMSGGVDSTVSAYLLQKEGHEVEGVYMKLHAKTPYHEENIQKTQKVADFLGIRLHILDLTEEFKRSVFDPFVHGYSKGLTPNPCAVCNRTIKFGSLVDFADRQGFDFLATGHYVKTDGKFLYEARDKSKDQSYFLFNIKKEVLPRLLFPVGDLLKEEVKQIARNIEPLKSFAQQKESTEICFVETTYVDVLKEFLDVNRPGEVIDLAGRVVGEHKGYMHYTIGKRKGFSVRGAHEPHYVVGIIPEKNQIVVGKKEDLAVEVIRANGLNMFDEREDFECSLKVRYRTPKVPCQVRIVGKEATIRLAQSVYGVASGQAAVFYENEKVLGGGWIKGIL